MKKILLACVIGSVLLLTGCKDSALKKAQDLISNGDYQAAVEILEKYADDENAAALLKQAQIDGAINDAEEAIGKKDYSAAVSLLEDFKEDNKALELYNSAKYQLIITELDGKWLNCSGGTLDGAFIEVKLTGGTGTSVLKHSVDNYYGYVNDDILWNDLKVSNNGSLSLSALKREINGGSEYADVTAAFNINENTIEFSDEFFGKWRKITDTEAASALNNDPKLTKAYDGTPIQRDPNALTDFGKKASELSWFVVPEDDYMNSELPYVYLRDYNEMDTYPSRGVVLKGGSLTDELYCGLTMAQIQSLNEREVIYGLKYYCPNNYMAYYDCTVNSTDTYLQLNFVTDETDSYVVELDFYSVYLWEHAKNDYEYWQYQKQQEEERRKAEEEAKQDIAYSTDGLLFYFGSVREYIASSNGQVAVCEPSMLTGLYLGDICMIENYSALDNTLILNSQGYLRKTNRRVTYRGTSYPVYRAVKVIQ